LARRKAKRRVIRRKTPTKRRKRPAKKRVSKGIKSQWSKISAGAGALSALSLITSHDMSSSIGQPVGIRAKNFVNSISGRVIGYSPFANEASAGGQINQTISVEGIFNKYTGIGLGLLGYAMIPARILPHKAKARQLGKSIATGGLLGGLFSVGNKPHTHNLISATHAPTINAGVT
tara:strand:- start:335 stop:862 length:528 start_codon:yes stop_codon:yes gene_type:complete